MRFCGLYIIEKSHINRDGCGRLIRENYWNVTYDKGINGYICDSYIDAMKMAIFHSHFHRNGRVCLTAGRNLR